MVKPNDDASCQKGEEFDEEREIGKKVTRKCYNWIYIAVILSSCVICGGVVAGVLLLTKPASSDNASASAPRGSVSEKTTSPYQLYMCGITLMEYHPSVPGDNIFSPHLHNVGEFNRPLECNFDMLSNLQGGATCCETTLSSIIANADIGAELLIPCGVCVIVDMDARQTIDLPGGLQIEGMLYFPPSADVTIRTTHVIVLGNLKIDTPDIDNMVTFSLYGEDDVIFENFAGHSSLELCSSLCNFGAKVIAVVGGRLEIKGTDPSCPAWEKLMAVSGSGSPSVAPGPAPVMAFPCGDANVLTNSDFEQGILNWVGYGNPRDIIAPGYDEVGNAIIATGRNNWSAGIYQSLNLTCVTKSQRWQVSTKVKLYNETTGNPVSCDTNVQMDCPLVRFYYRVGTDSHHFYEYYDTDMIWNEGNWNDLNVTVGIELDETTEVGIMICGGPIGAVLEVDDVAMIPIGEETQDAERSDYINQLSVSPEAANCWGPGTELLLTSHTRSDLDRQVVTVQGVDIEMRTITLTQNIVKPVTLQDHDDFAIEVASLTRRVVFEAESNLGDDLIGGHMIIYGTPNPQHLEGVEIRNFGQQGRLGRYPTHFHFCGNSTGSVMTKNVV
jgi:G8 domain